MAAKAAILPKVRSAAVPVAPRQFRRDIIENNIVPRTKVQ